MLSNNKTKELPSDLIEKILMLREIFIVVKHDPCYEFSTWNIIGVFNSIDDAKYKIINHVFTSNIINKNFYKPTRRFRKRRYGFLEDKMQIFDDWQSTIGVDDYSIECWSPNKNNVSNKIYFNLDNYIKTYISEMKLSDIDCENLFIEWEKNIPYSKLIECFSDSKVKSFPKIEEKDWYAFDLDVKIDDD